MPSPSPRLRNPVGFLLIPQFTVLSLASALEPLRIANRYIDKAYQWRILSADGRPVPDDNGILISPDAAIADVEHLGTLLICADQHPEQHVGPALRGWLRRLHQAGTQLVSIDAAAFVLARAGLLDDHPVTMHWEVSPAFSLRYPDVQVVNTLFEIGEGPISCAGGTAVLDLMLHLIESEHGEPVAQRVAEHCIRERHRRGSDSQRRQPPHARLALAMRAAESAEAGRLDVAEIARMVGVSERQLLRLYRLYLGESPARFHMAQRLDRARALLRSTRMSVREVGLLCGFTSAAHFTRRFRHHYGHPPSDERAAVTSGDPHQPATAAHERRVSHDRYG